MNITRQKVYYQLEIKCFLFCLDFNIGFYHFFSERTSPTRQAEDFYNAIKDKEYNIIPVLDVETNTQECMATGFINLVDHQWSEKRLVRGISGNVYKNVQRKLLNL